VRDLRALADGGVLDLHERAGLGALVQHGVRAQVGERADDRLPARGARSRWARRTVAPSPTSASISVVKRRSWRPRRSSSAPRMMQLGSTTVSWPIATPRRCAAERGSISGHARAHVALVDALLAMARTRARSTRSLMPSVTVQSLADVGGDLPAGLAHPRQHVGEVGSPWAVAGLELLERREQRAAVEGEDARVDLADRELGLARVRPAPWSRRRARPGPRRPGPRARRPVGSSSSAVSIVAPAPDSSWASTSSVSVSASTAARRR
jgi:hypothetical protein